MLTEDLGASQKSENSNPEKVQDNLETDPENGFDADDYLGGTEVYETQEWKKFQLESHFIFGKDLFSFAGDVEYGITDQLMISAEAEYDSFKGENGEESPLSSAYEFEVRYRLARQKNWPVDIAFALGTRAGLLRSQSVLWSVEPRLIIQRSIGRFSVTANFITALGRNFSPEISGGMRYEICKYTVLACEVLYDFHDRELVCIPQLFVAPMKGLTFQVGYTFSNESTLQNNIIAGILFEF